ncbi:hypothetical protein [Halodesulfovibrio spirochaetisodalis]|nr:hypothetical protein [Halodesulfovibrio spirochaetisodalis]
MGSSTSAGKIAIIAKKECAYDRGFVMKEAESKPAGIFSFFIGEVG